MCGHKSDTCTKFYVTLEQHLAQFSFDGSHSKDFTFW